MSVSRSTFLSDGVYVLLSGMLSTLIWDAFPPRLTGYFSRARHLFRVEFDRRRQWICRSWNSPWMRTL